MGAEAVQKYFESNPQHTAVDLTLGEWRRKATNVLMAASAVVYLPAIILMIAGLGPPLTRPLQAALLVTYLVSVFGALFRRIDHRTRLGAMVVAAYALGVLINIAIPQGPFARAFPVVLPMLTMVLLGARAGRVAAVVSAAILLFAPLLHNTPGFVGIITTAPTGTPPPPTLVWTQSAVLTGLMLAAMILLDRFHQLLVDAMAGLEHEAAKRSTEHSNLMCEMVERRRLERELARVGDEERRRLGHDVHDGVCQQLTGALLRCEALMRRLGRGETLASDDLNGLSVLLEESIDEAHAVAKGLCPLAPHPTALATALRTLTKRTQTSSAVPCRFSATGDVSVSDPEVAQHLYRIAQEALSNAARHAHASRISVELRGEDQRLALQVEDDGNGLPDTSSAGGMGLRTMAYRAHFLEGELTVMPAPHGGTRVLCRVPRGSITQPSEPPHAIEEVIHGH